MMRDCRALWFMKSATVFNSFFLLFFRLLLLFSFSAAVFELFFKVFSHIYSVSALFTVEWFR